ncbi:hypothetical protein LTR12_014860 [Friedmanniomyces endolithicus]|nr:hypothetical protein LTR12_014860 [Friedmanniomyces endolithicus]
MASSNSRHNQDAESEQAATGPGSELASNHEAVLNSRQTLSRGKGRAAHAQAWDMQHNSATDTTVLPSEEPPPLPEPVSIRGISSSGRSDTESLGESGPLVHRRESKSAKTAAHLSCTSKRNPERRYTLSTRPYDPAQDVEAMAHYQQQAQAQQIQQMTKRNLGQRYTMSQPPLLRTIPAQQASGMNPVEPDETESESESESQSETNSELERERERRDRNRTARLKDQPSMPSPARRPSPNDHTKHTRPALVRSTRAHVLTSEVDLGYISTSGYVGSHRNTRAVVDRPRTNSPPANRSRASLPTTVPRSRTKATTGSSGTASHKYIMEDRVGRRKEYLTKDQYNKMIRRYEVQKLEDQEMQDRIEAYQQHVRGTRPQELSAEDIRTAVGDARSKRLFETAKKDGSKIESGDTVLHVYGDARVEMRQGEDGTPAFILGNTFGNDRDSAYYSSKSSRSRISRGKDTSTEENDGYEKELPVSDRSIVPGIGAIPLSPSSRTADSLVHNPYPETPYNMLEMASALETVSPRFDVADTPLYIRELEETPGHAHAIAVQSNDITPSFPEPTSDASVLRSASMPEHGQGIFWINGKAGSGKSTLMKFLADHEQSDMHRMSNADGTVPYTDASHSYVSEDLAKIPPLGPHLFGPKPH